MKRSIKILILIFLSLFVSSYGVLSYYNKVSDVCLSQILQSDNSNDSYIKNSIQPKMLYVISENDMTKEEQTMISTLQGLVSNKSDEQIYILSSSEPDYEIWLKDLKSKYHVKTKNIKNPWKLLNKFKSYIKGYVLYSNSKNPSINNACSLASLKDSIAIDVSLENKLRKLGITNLIQDCIDTDKYWAYNNLWNLGLNHSTVIELSPDKTMALRDYAIMSKSLIFYEDEVNSTPLRENIFKSMGNSARCLGWGPDEHNNVNIASSFGVDVIAADWSFNLSVLSSYQSNPITQSHKNESLDEDDVHYVTFIMSDGDNQQWFLGSNYGSKKWYGSPHRGNFNLGWSISPSLYYLAPTVFNKYYDSATSTNYNDNFIVSPSGNGYIYPSKFPTHKLNNYTSRLNNYMEKVNQKQVIIIDDDAFFNKNLWDKYTCHSNIDGLFYLNYNKNNDYDGKLIWSNNKPIVSCRDLLWEGLEDEEQLIENINNRITLGYTDVNKIEAYTFVYVHVWSKTMDDVQYVITKLNNNSKVRIITPDTFIKLIQKNIPCNN